MDIYIGKDKKNGFEVIGWKSGEKYCHRYACTFDGRLMPEHATHQSPVENYPTIIDYLNHNNVEDAQKRLLQTNEFHPRMFRPFVKIKGTGNPVAHANTLRSVGILNQRLEKLFESVYPHPDNFGTYSDECRNLLLLACMEVEAAWAGVLRANGYHKDRLNTADYFKVGEPLLLKEYVAFLPLAPHINSISPFKEWNSLAPTQSLDWYDAYNKTKHDREAHFSEATMLRALTAVSAANITCLAQFGETPTNEFLCVDWNYGSMPAKYLHLCHGPGDVWTPVNYQFT